MKFRQEWLIITCDSNSHDAPVVARSFVRIGGGWALHNREDADTLRNDTAVPDETTWNELHAPGARVRVKWHIRCACGADLQLTDDLAMPVFDRLIDGGVSSITLQRLGVIVSRHR